MIENNYFKFLINNGNIDIDLASIRDFLNFWTVEYMTNMCLKKKQKNSAT